MNAIIIFFYNHVCFYKCWSVHDTVKLPCHAILKKGHTNILKKGHTKSVFLYNTASAAGTVN